MKVSDFNFDLPPELIAQFPPENRTDSRLLKLMQGRSVEDARFPDILDELGEGDLVVLNDTRVLPARLFGAKETGGRVEVLLERITSEFGFIAQVRSSKSPKPGQSLYIDGDDEGHLSIVGRQGIFFEIEASISGSLHEWLASVGHMPLPPYIERSDEEEDLDRYQTVFAEKPGAVAAPTAGLHYDEELLTAMEDKGVRFQTVTLHVGAGTYQPVRVDKLDEHQMHSEYIEVSEEVCAVIRETKLNGGKVLAVGTTVVRSLETAARHSNNGLIDPYFGETDIFIYPGFNFKVVDLMQTNFHLPESTLIMLVSAFAGYDEVMNAYQHAVSKEYRFFSYGDAMLLERKPL